MDALIQRAQAEIGPHLAVVIQMMYDGVAFRKNNSTYEMFGRGGDELGEISVADISYAIMAVKRLGRAVGKYKDQKYNWETKTFAWMC